MPFLSDQKNWRAPRPPPTLIFSPKSTDQNFEIAILFRTKTIITMSLGMTYSPTVPVGGAASYKLRPVFTYNNGYWEVYSVFRGFCFWFWGWEDLSLEKYVMVEQKLNEKGSGFSKITIKKNNEKINMEKFFSIES